jgi:hypothetical protein
MWDGSQWAYQSSSCAPGYKAPTSQEVYNLQGGPGTQNQRVTVPCVAGPMP